MKYAVVQKTLDIPPVEKIEAALVTVKGFTRADAHIFANDAYGILVKNIPAEQANAFSQALFGQGIETEVVAQTSLPELPATKFVQRLDCTSESLLIYDSIGRSFPLEWQHVMLVAAGCVRSIDFSRVEKRIWPGRIGSDGEVFVDSRNVEERNDQLILEILVSGAVMRYSVSAEKFRFDYLAERRTNGLEENFQLLVQDIAACAPHAMLNRGAFFLKANESPFRYPSKNAFFEEISWLLWRMKQEAKI